jgi:hypothetical protein
MVGLQELVDGVRRLGVDTASEIVRRFGSGGTGTGAGAGAAAPHDTSAGHRRLRPGADGSLLMADVERALDAYLAVTRELYDLLSRRAVPDPPGEDDVLVLPAATPDGGTSAVLWVHGPAVPPGAGAGIPEAAHDGAGPGGRPATQLRLVAGPLLSDRGEVVAGRLRCRPEVVPAPPAGERTAVTVSVDATGLATGRYRATLVSVGDPDAAIGVVVDVVRGP